MVVYSPLDVPFDPALPPVAVLLSDVLLSVVFVVVSDVLAV